MIDQFNIPNIELLLSLDYKVTVACNFKSGNTCSDARISALKEKLTAMSVDWAQIDFSRSVTSFSDHFSSYKKLKALIDTEKFELIHCHSPIGSMICRLAARRSRKRNGTTVIYTAHGFHFYRGAPLKNWVIFYPIEKLCSRFTDILITINREDREMAKAKLKAKRIEYINGVGIDTSRFGKNSDGGIREELGIPADAFLITSVGELNTNKNHEVVIRAMASLNDPRVYYCIAGRGEKGEYLSELADKLGIADRVHLLGFRTDIAAIYADSDACALPSIREGLPLAALEGMASGLPLIVSDNRGSRDYAVNGENAFVLDYNDTEGFAKAIGALLRDPSLAEEMGKKNLEAVKLYDISHINEKMKEIYL